MTDPRTKLLCLLGFVLVVVVTPPRYVGAFAVYAGVVIAAAAVVDLPLRTLPRRMVVELPFVVFAAALPFIGTGPHTDVAGVSLSVPGCWAAWSIVAKASLGTAAAVVLGWTTPAADVLVGLERLHVPRVLTAIAGFMIRYLEVIRSELARLQVARVSRCDDPRWAWQGKAVAATAGTLFIRSYERGERIQQAMAARGFDGTFPDTDAGAD